MNNYEMLYIIASSVDENAREDVIKKYESVITENGGNVDNIDKWGMKKFAYPINYKNDGFYVLMTFSSNSELPKEIERQMRISDDIVRFMVIRK